MKSTSIFLPLYLVFWASFQPAAFSQNHALAMDDVDDFVELSQHASSLIFNNPATIEFWFKPNFDHRGAVANENNFSPIWALGNGGTFSGGKNFRLIYGSHSNAYLNERLSIAYDLPTSGSGKAVIDNNQVQGQWHHYAAVCTENDWLFYIDGANVASVQAAGSNVALNGAYGNDIVPALLARIGYNSYVGSGGFINGSIDEFRLWKTVRTSAEIAANYDKSICVPQEGLLVYYKFNMLEDLGQGFAGTNDLYDYSGNNHHGDIIGGATLTVNAAPLNSTETCNGCDDDGDDIVDEDTSDADNDGICDDLDECPYALPNLPNFNLVDCDCEIGYQATTTEINGQTIIIGCQICPTEICGNQIDDDCDGEVDEDCGPPLTVSAGVCQTVYYGYPPNECTDLTALAADGTPPYTYLWSTGATSTSISVCPINTTEYAVTTTDADGATATDGVTVEVVDVHCGQNNNKVNLCHIGGNDKTLCVAQNAVAEHLSHGDYLGPCGTNPCITEGKPGKSTPRRNTSVGSHFLTTSDFDLIPNPAGEYVTVNLEQYEGGEVYILFSNFLGQRVIQRHLSLVANHQAVFDLGDLKEGIYTVTVIDKGRRQSRILTVLGL